MLSGEDEEAMVARLATTDDPSSESIWTFGFGSNMNVELLGSKKGLAVLEHATGVVKGWKMAFQLKGMSFVEPSWADAQCTGGAEDEIHGVAVRLSLADYAKLSKQERGYRDAEVNVQVYGGGRVVASRIFTAPAERLQPEEVPCSRRYLGALVAGARAAGIDAAYVDALERRPTYVAPPPVLARRAALPPAASLPPFTVAELWDGYSSEADAEKEAKQAAVAATADGPGGDGGGGDAAAPEAGATKAKSRVACLGYILETSSVRFSRHKGRDITARASRQWRGLPLDDGDDWGKPPFPSAGRMDPGEREFVLNWLDFYLGKEDCEVVGFLTEFRAQAEAEAKAEESAAKLRAAYVCR